MVKKIPSVLVIDDNPADLEWCRIMMEDSGRYSYIFTASNGAEAIELFEDYERSRAQHGEMFPPLVILLDINMPIMNGFDFLEKHQSLVKSSEHQISSPVVLMLTSSAERKDKQACESYTFVEDYIVKPLTEERATEIAEAYGQD